MALAGVLIGGLYAVLFWATMDVPPVDAVLYAGTNAVPLVLLAGIFGLVVRGTVRSLSLPYQVLAHAVLAVSFAATWYGAVIVLQALVRLAQGRGFVPGHFAPQALAWQAFQGVALYAAVAATSYAIARQVQRDAPPPTDRLERYFSKAGDTIRCIQVRDIVSISGAQDYSDVTTTSGRHLARFSLGEFERRLDPTRFLRIHRSGIVNLDHFDRAEPAGSGCFLVTLRNGETLRTSREGARKLRALLF